MRPSRKRETMKQRILIVISIAALLNLSLGAGQPNWQGISDALTIGEWNGQAAAGGLTSTSSQSSKIIGFGTFTTNLHISVPPGPGEVGGSWTLDGSSSWQFDIPEAGMQIGASMNHSAAGAVTGSPSDFSLGVAQIKSDIRTPGLTLTSSDPIGPIDLEVVGDLCDEAWGEWILSWDSELSGAGYTPTFEGEWYAVRVRPDDGVTEEYTDALLQATEDLNNEIQSVFLSATADPETQTFLVPYDAIWDLIERAVSLHNQIRNLEKCERVDLSPDEYETWIYGITNKIVGLATTLLENHLVSDKPLSGADLITLTGFLQSAGAIGPGALVDTDVVERALEEVIADVLADQDVSDSEKAKAVVAAGLAGVDLPDDFDPSSLYPGSVE